MKTIRRAGCHDGSVISEGWARRPLLTPWTARGRCRGFISGTAPEQSIQVYLDMSVSLPVPFPSFDSPSEPSRVEGPSPVTGAGMGYRVQQTLQIPSWYNVNQRHSGSLLNQIVQFICSALLCEWVKIHSVLGFLQADEQGRITMWCPQYLPCSQNFWTVVLVWLSTSLSIFNSITTQHD